MVAFKLSNFGGMVPAVDDRLLPEGAAALSQNAWLYAGSLQGMRTKTLLHTCSSNLVRRVYRIPYTYTDKTHIRDSAWLEFTNPDTDVISSPTVGDAYDRFYWASSQSFDTQVPQYNTKARIVAGQSAFTLGIPAPSVAPTITRTSGKYVLNSTTLAFNMTKLNAGLYRTTNYSLDTNSLNNNPITTPSTSFNLKVQGFRAEMRYSSATNRVVISDQGAVSTSVPSNNSPAQVTTGGIGILESRAYIYTWVSAYGEEGPPSPATVYNGYSGDPWLLKVTSPSSSDSTNRNLATTRIYRTITSAAGIATYFLVAEIPIAQTTYTDTITSDIVSGNNQLQSLLWSAPPSDLEGMVTMANGMVAGWRKNEIWFCEPYRPHAWPASYALALEFNIIGLGVMGQTLIACTTGHPYAVVGINPSSMSMSRIATYEPCLSRASIISGVDGVMYASPNGLVLAAAGVVSVISRDMISKDKWQDLLGVETLRAAKLNGAYYCWGSIRPGCFDPIGFQTTAFLQDDFSSSYMGALFAYMDKRVAYTELTTSLPISDVSTDHWTGEVFVLTGGVLYWMDISSTPAHDPFLWRSKVFDFPNKRNLEGLRVYFTVPPGTPTQSSTANTDSVQTLASNQYGIVRVYADDVLIFTREMRTSGELMRLPSGFKAIYWEIEIEARVTVFSLEVATTVKELMNV